VCLKNSSRGSKEAKLEALLQDVRYGARMLAKSPGFTIIAVLTLALGIGANTSIFSVVNSALLRPLPFHDSGRLVRVWSGNSRTKISKFSNSYPDFADWRAQNNVFENIAAYNDSNVTLTGIDEPAHLEIETVSAELFELLGIAPELGRTFLPEEDEPHHHVAILSHSLWKDRFASDPGIIGRPITLDGSAYTVVGVMPASVQFPILRKSPALWTSLSALQETSDGSTAITKQRGAHFLLTIARLKPGVSLPQAQADMDAVAASLQKQYPDTNKYARVTLVPEQEEMTGSVRPALLVLLVAVGFVLLIACVNVANLLLARATTRSREIAIRSALGAGRARIVRQLLIESLLLALAGGALGVVLAAWASGLVLRLSPQDLLRSAHFQLDGMILGFSAAGSVFTGILFGLAPALQVSRSNIVDTLKESAISATAGAHSHRLLSALVIAETALALVLLISAGLLIRSLVLLCDVNPGFDPHNVMTSVIDLPDERYSNAKKVEAIRDLIPRLKALPGVESVAAIEPLPMSGDEFRVSFQIEGRPVAKSEAPVTSVRIITPDYFTAMKIPLLQGRGFKDSDEPDSNQVIVVNEAFARKIFPGENPIGKHFQPGISADDRPGRMREIVGVVGNVKYRDLSTEWTPESYIPYAQLPFGTMTIVARTANDPSSAAKPIAETVRSLDKDLAAYSPKTLEGYLNETVAIPRFNTVLLGTFAILALLLTAIGLYGVISYSVAQRTHEMGIRMALGAQPGDMLRLVVGQGVRLAMTGVALGLIAAFALTRYLSSLLFGVTSHDPLSFLGVVLLLFAVVLLACYIPARRATRVDPLVALRYE
jgi:putative ABC transport system permease protein